MHVIYFSEAKNILRNWTLCIRRYTIYFACNDVAHIFLYTFSLHSHYPFHFTLVPRFHKCVCVACRFAHTAYLINRHPPPLRVQRVEYSTAASWSSLLLLNIIIRGRYFSYHFGSNSVRLTSVANPNWFSIRSRIRGTHRGPDNRRPTAMVGVGGFSPSNIITLRSLALLNCIYARHVGICMRFLW